MDKSSTTSIIELILYITLAIGTFWLGNDYIRFFITPVFIAILIYKLKLFKVFFAIDLKDIPRLGICIVLYLVSIGFCFGATKMVKEAIPNAPFFNSSTRERELESVFNSFNGVRYEKIPELESRICPLEHRFTYILTALVTVEETNKNNKKRTNNLKTRRKNYYNNVDKINERCNKAGIEKHLVNTSPINEENVNLDPMYKRIMLWVDDIKRNSKELPPCNTVCAFNHIDQDSLNIVKEIDNIMAEQDSRNLYLTQQEQQYDKLESLQRSKENYLTKLNF